jgi:hypothetical protein
MPDAPSTTRLVIGAIAAKSATARTPGAPGSRRGRAVALRVYHRKHLLREIGRRWSISWSSVSAASTRSRRSARVDVIVSTTLQGLRSGCTSHQRRHLLMSRLPRASLRAVFAALS